MTTLIAMLTTAFTATESPPLAGGEPFDPEKYELLGDVPLPVQWLHSLGRQLAIEVNSDIEAFNSRSGEMTVTEMKTKSADIEKRRALWQVSDSIKWTLLREAFVLDEEHHACVAILDGWKAAAMLRGQHEDEEVKDFLSKMFGGAMMVFAGRR